MVPESLLLEATVQALIGHLSRRFPWVSPARRVPSGHLWIVKFYMQADLYGKRRIDYAEWFDEGDPGAADELGFQVRALRAFERYEVAEHWMGDDV